MSGTDEFLANLLAALGDLFEPLDRAADGGDGLRELLAQLGWALEPGAAAAPAGMVSIAGKVTELANQAHGLADGNDAAAATALEDVVAIAAGIGQLATTAGLPDAFQDPRLPEKIFGLLTYDYLANYKPRIFAVTRLVGIVDEKQMPAPHLPGEDRLPAPDPPSEFAHDYLERRVVLSRVGMAVTNPGQLPVDIYGWGTKDFQAGTLLRVLEITGRAFGMQVSDDMTVGLDLYWDDDVVTNQAQRALVLPMWSGIAGPAAAQLELVIVPLPVGTGKGSSTTKPEGIAIFPRFTGKIAARIPLTDAITLTVDGAIADEGVVRAELRPTGPALFVDSSVADIAEVSVAVGVEIAPPDPYIVIGAAASSRLEIARAHAELGIGLELGHPLMHIDVGLDQASLVIDLGKGDGFLQKLLGGEPQQLDFGVGLRWSTKDGLRVNGTAALRLELPVHLDLCGVAQIDTIHLILGATAGSDPGAQLEVSIDGGLTLGPFAAQVERLGVAMNLVSSPKHLGSMGDMDLVFAFKPPNGVGFVVDAGPVKGGGYVGFDVAKGEYTGILDLEVAGTFAIRAIGILSTRMPDGRPGFSMLLIITAEFSPIQLGYGFTLNGVGGVIGINRTMNREFLKTGIHSGALESILFPPDPVAHAAEVISNLKQGFPIAEGRFIFGPMVKIGWASVITLEVGVLLELPIPVVLALLGRLSCRLPKGDDPVLILQMDILGLIDFGTGDISIDATLNDSRIVTFPITGDFAMRANVGAHPDFALSAGGFHPRFTPPPSFPPMKRLGISISNGDNPRLRLESYFAVTTNTVQTGARAELYVAADMGVLGNYTAQAELGFDALMHFTPFSFEVSLYGSASIERNGADLASADLEFVLEGPTPWHVHGHAVVHFLGDHELPIDHTFGDPGPTAATPATDVADLVRAAVGNANAWAALPPSEGRGLVTLRDIGEAAGLLVHPLSALSVHQRVAPLATRLDQFGTGPIAGATTVEIEAVTFSGIPAHPVGDIYDSFAPAQFFALTDDQKLTRPSFEKFPAGKKVETASFMTGTPTQTDQRYVTIAVDNPELAPRDDLADLANAYRSPIALRESMTDLLAGDRYVAADQGIAVADPTWAVAGRSDLATTTFHATYTKAAESMDQGTGVGNRRIVSGYEAVGP